MTAAHPLATRPWRGRAFRVLRGLGCFLLGLILLWAAFCLEENWRGARAWEAAWKQLLASGEKLDWRQFVPPRIPDEQNLALISLFARELGYRVDPKTHVYTVGPVAESPGGLQDMPYGVLSHKPFPPAGWDLARRTDLESYQRFYRQADGFPHADQPGTPAAAVLLALGRYTPALDELARGAEQRPGTRFPLDWEHEPFGGAPAHTTLALKLVTTLRLRASGRLAAGQAGEALRDIELALRLGGDFRREPLLLPNLMECACLNLALTPIWEGLADRRWSTEELGRLQRDLQGINLPEDFAAMMRGERAFGIRYLDGLKQGQDASALLNLLWFQWPASGDSPWRRWAVDLAPAGWYDLNKALIVRYDQNTVIGAVDARLARFFPERAVAGAKQVETLPNLPTNAMFKLTAVIGANLSRRNARLQAAVGMAATACALERWFAEKQAYPENLAALVPDYLPQVPGDVIGGEALRYQRTEDGRYRLYSIGWNAQDDGGKVAWSGPRSLKEEAGDWVWQYTPLGGEPAGKP